MKSNYDTYLCRLPHECEFERLNKVAMQKHADAISDEIWQWFNENPIEYDPFGAIKSPN